MGKGIGEKKTGKKTWETEYGTSDQGRRNIGEVIWKKGTGEKGACERKQENTVGKVECCKRKQGRREGE